MRVPEIPRRWGQPADTSLGIGLWDSARPLLQRLWRLLGNWIYSYAARVKV